jgi:hypothetical protein
MMRPTVATVATVAPEMAPKPMAAPTVARPRPPRTPRNIAMNQRIRRSAIPPRPISSPANRKNGIAIRVNDSSEPNITCGTRKLGIPTRVRINTPPARKHK